MNKRKIQLIQTNFLQINKQEFIKIDKKIKLKGIFNTETIGITCEYSICDNYFIQTPPNLRSRVNVELKTQISPILDNIISNYFNITTYIGNKNGAVDFITDNNKNISLKTNIRGDKVAPQIIGQATKKKFCEYFKLSTLIESRDIKEYIIININKVLQEYLKHLFCCDYLIYLSSSLNKDKTEINIKSLTIIDCIIVKKLTNIIKKSNITFTKYLDNWNESSTIKINNISIGEFQIHNNRDNIKFRFNFKNLLKLII